MRQKALLLICVDDGSGWASNGKNSNAQLRSLLTNDLNRNTSADAGRRHEPALIKI